jgi:ribosomal protein L37AE/L43A
MMANGEASRMNQGTIPVEDGSRDPARCVVFACGKAELRLDDASGFWLCPLCGLSYGKDAQKPFDPFELDSVE